MRRRTRSRGSRPSCSSARRATLPSSASRSSRRSCSRPVIRTRPARRACCGTTSPILPRRPPTVSGSAASDLVVDIGSNDGTLLASFHERGHARARHRADRHRRSWRASAASRRCTRFFDAGRRGRVLGEHGPAADRDRHERVRPHRRRSRESSTASRRCSATTACSSRSRTTSVDLIETLQYDTIYHEHLRYYSLTSLEHLLERARLSRSSHVKRIPTHGGSIRVYADARRITRSTQASRELLADERASGLADDAWISDFRRRVVQSKLDLLGLLRELKLRGRPDLRRSAHRRGPARSSTTSDSTTASSTACSRSPARKSSDKYIPGTAIPVLDEQQALRRSARIRAAAVVAHRRRAARKPGTQRLPGEVRHSVA